MAQCQRTGCVKPAVYAPKLTVPLAGIISDKDQPFIAMIPALTLCKEHMDAVRPAHFPNLKDLFLQKLGGKNVDWNRAVFMGVRLDSTEFKALDGQIQVAPPSPLDIDGEAK